VLTDASGVPLGVAVAGANRHDVMLLAATLASIVVRRPRPTARTPQGVCLDKAYDITWVYRLLSDAGFTPHVRAIREDVTARRRGTRARRWVVERTHSWLNRFRALLVRWDKQTANYEGSLHLACAYITFARAGLLG
jgi:putative transposase